MNRDISQYFIEDYDLNLESGKFYFRWKKFSENYDEYRKKHEEAFQKYLEIPATLKNCHLKIFF